MVSVPSVRRADGEAPNEVELPEDVFLGRQPVLDVRQQLWGYELLYRENERSNVANVQDAMVATSTVVINTIAELGVERVVGKHKMLINCPTQALVPAVVSLLPQDQVVLEVLETVDSASEQVRANLEQLNRAGYKLAINDYDGSDARSDFLTLASIVKVDLSLVSEAQLDGLVASLKKKNVTLLAEKVESLAQFEICKKLGFELFQGFYFCRPEIVKGKRPPANQMAVLRLLAKVNDPKTSREELAKLISDDVSMSFRLLRCLNSAAFAFVREVQTVEHALMLLGEARLRQWVSMLAVSKIPNKPSELSRTALLRAHMCERLAEKMGGKVNPKLMFTVGLFSVLDTMMDVSMSKVVKELPLSDDIIGALLGKPSALAGILSMVVSYERGDYDELSSLGMRADELTGIWMEATRTMEESFDYLAAEGAQK